MSGMTLGGMIEADRRVRAYEMAVRMRKKGEEHQRVWEKWGGLVEGEGKGEGIGEKLGRGTGISGRGEGEY